MRHQIVYICLFLMSLSLNSLGQSWPEVDYSYVRVGNYNLQSDLRGNHEPIKEGELDSSVLNFAPILPQTSVKSLLEIINKKDQLLLDGLSKCYIPHHCFIFYNDSHQPVASVSVCFMCEKIEVYPEIEIQVPKRIKEKQIQMAQSDLKDIKSIMLQAEDAEYHEIAFFDDVDGYEAYGRMIDGVPQIIRGGFKNTFKGYQFSEFRDKNYDRLRERHETKSIIGVGNYLVRYRTDSSNSFRFFSEVSYDKSELLEFNWTDEETDPGLPIKLGMLIEEVNNILIEKSGVDVFSGMFYGQSSIPYLHIEDQLDKNFQLKLHFENSVLTRVEKLKLYD